MDEALRWLRRTAFVLLLPLAVVAAIALIVVVATLFYLKALAIGIGSMFRPLFVSERQAPVKPLPGPHFQERLAKVHGREPPLS